MRAALTTALISPVLGQDRLSKERVGFARTPHAMQHFMAEGPATKMCCRKKVSLRTGLTTGPSATGALTGTRAVGAKRILPPLSFFQLVTKAETKAPAEAEPSTSVPWRPLSVHEGHLDRAAASSRLSATGR